MNPPLNTSAWIGPAVRQTLELVFPRGANTVSKR